MSPKRVAARYRLAKEFELGSVSVRESSAEGLKPKDSEPNSFLASFANGDDDALRRRGSKPVLVVNRGETTFLTCHL